MIRVGQVLTIPDSSSTSGSSSNSKTSTNSKPKATSTTSNIAKTADTTVANTNISTSLNNALTQKTIEQKLKDGYFGLTFGGNQL